MAKMLFDLVMFGVISAFVLLRVDNVSGGEGVRIKTLTVPEVLLNGTDKPAVLDCDYVLDIPAAQSGLVVKWFFNNHPAPVYQWIYNKKPQVLGVLKGKVNMAHRTTNDEATMYRGFEIMTPTMELSGEYKCLVSTFDKEDSKSKKMIVYVPERSMEVTQHKPKVDQVTINCSAEGMYPEPNMTILALNSKHNGFIQVTTKKISNSSLYEIRASLTVDDIELNYPTTFECVVSIPDAKYSSQRELIYFPGPPTTTTEPTGFDHPLPTSGASASTLSSSFLALVSLSIFITGYSTSL